ncbi:uncharacterized protein PG998_004770 [Apiospora kogelbergensis]|uniref:uncharacterized protein n=1 Tax=Apiospora kogelbergensis TaxID=1337665 RepID=UPI0031312A57
MGSFAVLARQVYNPIGFSKGYNFILWFCLSGAMLGFCLARLQYLNFYGVMCNPDRSKPSAAAPGECFHLSQPLYSIGMILHLAGVLPGGMLALVQFVPMVRYKALLVHRVNGYLVILLALVGIAGGFIITRPTMGGQLDVQSSAGFLGIAFFFAMFMAYVNIKRLRIDLHRAWMIRAWVWAGSIITIRIIFFLAFLILPMTGTYYLSQPCDKLAWLFNDDNKTVAAYPECEAWLSQQNSEQRVHVRAEWSNSRNVAEKMTSMNLSFGIAMWIGLVIHFIGTEVYFVIKLYLTPAETLRLRNVSIQRRIEAGMQTAVTSADLAAASENNGIKGDPTT